MTTLDYDDLAAEYARHRRVYPGLVEHVLERAPLRRDSTVLEVGCGTANHLTAIKLATGARCVGIDPSTEMLALAASQPADLELRTGAAEDGLARPGEAFDLILSVDVIHYVREPARYFARGFRALEPGGWLCTVTDSEYVIRNRQPMVTYFPATAEVDLARYHPVPALMEQLVAAGFDGLDERLIESDYSVTEPSRFEDRSYSSLHLISDDDFARGIERMRADLARGPIVGVLRSSVLWGRRPS